VSVIVIAVVAGLPAIGYAQQDGGQFSVQWNDVTVADALAALQRQFGIQYALSGELSSRRITLSLDNVTPVQALQQILLLPSTKMVSGAYGKLPRLRRGVGHTALDPR